MAVPEVVVEHSNSLRTPEDALSPIVAVTSSPGPSEHIPPQEETSDEMLAMHTVDPITASPGPSQPGTSPTPASFAGRTNAERIHMESTRGANISTRTARRSAHRPLVLRTLDTAIYFLLALVVIVACRKIC